MRKVLILAYEFPPYISVGGFRPYSWYKYMPEFGVKPIVITRQWENKYGNILDYVAPTIKKTAIIEESINRTLIKAPYFPNIANKILLKYGENKFKWCRRIISAYYEFFQFIFPCGPKIEIYKEASEYLKYNKVDFILATGDPFILFHYASKLGRKHNTPWVADYRDPWSHDISKQNKILNIWSTYYEKKIVKNARFIVTVSDFINHQINSIIPNKNIHVIPNGYDPEIIDSAEEVKQNSEILSIALAGSIYKWNPIYSFLSVISKFTYNNPNKNIHVNFYGINIREEIQSKIKTEFPNIESNISIYNKMNYKDLIKELAKNNLMLLFNYYSYMGTKIYDYIGIKRSILMCYSNDPKSIKLKKVHYNVQEISGISEKLQEDLIKKINAGYIAKNENDLYEIIHQLYDEFTNRNFIECKSINSNEFSRKYQIKKLVDIINKSCL